MVKNLPTMWETWLQFLGWEDPLEKGMATQSSILAWRIPWSVHSMGLQSQTRLSDFHSLMVVLDPFVLQLLSHVRLCNLMNCSMPGSSVLHYLPEFAQIHVL